MRIETLTKEQVKMVYRTYMCNDFPKNERKPLDMILKAMDAGIYECFGLCEDGELFGYAFFVRQGADFLFDYLAIRPDRRDGGLGSTFLQLLRAHFSHAECILGEVEDPAYARNPQEAETRSRRLSFYTRNGFLLSPVTAETFGVRYLLIEMDLGCQHDAEEIRRLYRAHYRAVLRQETFDKHVHVF